MTNQRVKATATAKKAQQTAKQSVNVDAIAQRTAEQSRQRKAQQSADAKQSKKQTQSKAQKAKKSAEQTQKAESTAERTKRFAERVQSVIDCYTERYEMITDTCADDYIRVNRHSSHKTYLQIYCKKQYVLFLISVQSVDPEKDAFQHDTESAERISNQKCYARYKASYESAEQFLRSLTDYDNRKQTAQQTSATERTESAQRAQ